MAMPYDQGGTGQIAMKHATLRGSSADLQVLVEKISGATRGHAGEDAARGSGPIPSR